MDKHFLVQLGCKRVREGALVKCHRAHEKTIVPSSKFIDLLPPQTFLRVQLRGSPSERKHTCICTPTFDNFQVVRL